MTGEIYATISRLQVGDMITISICRNTVRSLGDDPRTETYLYSHETPLVAYVVSTDTIREWPRISVPGRAGLFILTPRDFEFEVMHDPEGDS